MTFGLLVRALLSDVAKKNCWGLSEHVGLAHPQRFQHFLNAVSWDADVLRDEVRGVVLNGLADVGGALVLDDTQVIKKGVESVGVAYQHCGLTGQTENCQVMVMLTYASVHGHAFIDWELYLPVVWTPDRARCVKAGVPADRGFVTKPHLGINMLTRALADARLAFRWVVADSGYGRDPYYASSATTSACPTSWRYRSTCHCTAPVVNRCARTWCCPIRASGVGTTFLGRVSRSV